MDGCTSFPLSPFSPCLLLSFPSPFVLFSYFSSTLFSFTPLFSSYFLFSTFLFLLPSCFPPIFHRYSPSIFLLSSSFFSFCQLLYCSSCPLFLFSLFLFLAHLFLHALHSHVRLLYFLFIPFFFSVFPLFSIVIHPLSLSLSLSFSPFCNLYHLHLLHFLLSLVFLPYFASFFIQLYYFLFSFLICLSRSGLSNLYFISFSSPPHSFLFCSSYSFLSSFFRILSLYSALLLFHLYSPPFLWALPSFISAFALLFHFLIVHSSLSLILLSLIPSLFHLFTLSISSFFHFCEFSVLFISLLSLSRSKLGLHSVIMRIIPNGNMGEWMQWPVCCYIMLGNELPEPEWLATIYACRRLGWEEMELLGWLQFSPLSFQAVLQGSQHVSAPLQPTLAQKILSSKVNIGATKYLRTDTGSFVLKAPV